MPALIVMVALFGQAEPPEKTGEAAAARTEPFTAYPSEVDPKAAELRGRRLVAVAAAVLADQPDARALVAGLARVYPRDETVRAVRGLDALLRDDLRSAARWLPETVRWAAYRAMAAVERPGGLARAREILAEAARDPGSPPDVLFLASLAFQAAGQSERANALLRRALRAAPAVLHETFAPDPAVALAHLVVEFAPPDSRSQDRLTLGEALVTARRRGAARRLVDEVRGDRAAKIRWATWDRASPRRALAAARSASKSRPELALVVAEAQFGGGGTPSIPTAPMPSKRWDARRDRLRARVALGAGHSADALDLARAAARGQPEDPLNVAAVVRALLANGEPSRARAFAEVVLERRPLDVNPYALLLAVERARPSGKKSRRRSGSASSEAEAGLRLLGKSWSAAQMKLRRARARRERVLSAARDADGGLGATGLEAVRTTDAQLSLPIDLALAKYGSPGAAASARDRVLRRCAPHFRSWLERRGDWDFVFISASPYGKALTVRVELSDADPGRCPSALPRVGGGGRR